VAELDGDFQRLLAETQVSKAARFKDAALAIHVLARSSTGAAVCAECRDAWPCELAKRHGAT